MLPITAALTVIPTRIDTRQYAVSMLLVGITSPITTATSVGKAQFSARMYADPSVKLLCVT